ncbi:hypothetical protein [Acinetobacter sp.]|uniref:hypothetical protein n=1 Tax=Acinetobacter sp. TaxID=472 RepID=UPI002FDABAE4
MIITMVSQVNSICPDVLYNPVKNEQAYDSKLFQIHITEMKQRQALNLASLP